MTWGLHDAVAKTLTDTPGIQTVVLNSTGGIVPAGYRIAAMIKARKLDTLTTSNCASACTLAFAAGERRLLTKGARLGFHSETPVFNTEEGSSPDMLTKLSKEHTSAYWRSAGVAEASLREIFATPPEELWFPSTTSCAKPTSSREWRSRAAATTCSSPFYIMMLMCRKLSRAGQSSMNGSRDLGGKRS